ncbi:MULTISPECIES: tetratricopeptide repeat protein [unclassified Coleofasciculus]|uniref:tetratricopeptide repeat protein n=1 Tax=unclassified Coleofasciculus TaxID=2692782 RepID=UPI001882C6A6|nr:MULTISPECIES: tetratricopeptide repeat protein [unclassified Coleofasciculus]MBE9129720.1 tetratricopeptide repeat protein [Coleofasciculus sp. LEGE 07081]MBE9151082.1 tetratricopeptide repeat protein [Coleofasciculus sp. LEGE 07092]
MTDSLPLRDRYIQLIDDIVQATLKGKIRSKEQVYQMLLSGVSSGTGEIFERCLEERLNTTQQQVDNPVSEMKQAKAMRAQRALNTISSEWQRVQEQNRVLEAIATATQAVTHAEPTERLTALLRAIDPNREPVLTLSQLTQLAKTLQQDASAISNPDHAAEIQQLSQGIRAGLASWGQLENDLVSWIYDQNQGSLGFEGSPDQRGPWSLWAKKVNSPLPQSLFQALASNQPLHEWIRQQPSVELDAWVELAVILQYLQRRLIAWFDQRVYASKLGARLSISTYIVFAVIWSQLAITLNQVLVPQRERLVNSCFQVTLQILRAFAQRDYFPLYGGVFASLSGQYLRDTMNYLNEPLRRVEGTQEKARILTLLGYSQRAQGQYKRATAFHQEALEIAQEAGDRTCEIANFNHLSRTCVAQKNYTEAINYSQRALILARQTGDKLGEANALANLGYSEVFQAQQQLEVEPEVYESAINYLQQGRQLLERLGDKQSQALCLSSLGIAYVVIQQPQDAIAYLEQGWQAAQFSGDLYLQGVNLAYLAQANYSLQDLEKTIYTGSLGAYLLEQIGAEDWRQAAGLLVILQGQLGVESFQELLAGQRSKIIAVIGVDGYDYIPELLEKYRSSI